MQASMPIRHGGRLASRASTWPRDHFWRSTRAPRRSWPTMWNEFLPISMPITAILLLSFSDMECSFVFGAPLASLARWQGWSTAGPSHSETWAPEHVVLDEAARHVSECLPHSLEVRHDEHSGDGGWICVGRTAAGGSSGDHGKGALLLGDDGRRGRQRQRAAHGSAKIAGERRSLRHFIPHPPRFPQGAGDRPYRPAERGLST